MALSFYVLETQYRALWCKKSLAQKRLSGKNYKKDTINIVSVGRLHYQKGYELAIQSIKLLHLDGFKVRYHIYGDGSQKTCRGISKNTVLTDDLINVNLVNVFRNADVFIDVTLGGIWKCRSRSYVIWK